jgi:hypothetical protein
MWEYIAVEQGGPEIDLSRALVVDMAWLVGKRELCTAFRTAGLVCFVSICWRRGLFWWR